MVRISVWLAYLEYGRSVSTYCYSWHGAKEIWKRVPQIIAIFYYKCVCTIKRVLYVCLFLSENANTFSLALRRP